MVRKIGWGEEDHNLDWLDEFTPVPKSEDPEIRAAIERIDKRKQQLNQSGGNDDNQ